MPADIDDKGTHDWLLQRALMSSHVHVHTAGEGMHSTESYRTHSMVVLLVRDVQLFGSPRGAVYVGMREELSSSIA